MPLLEGGAAGSMGPADLEAIGVEIVAVDLLELAVSPGFEALAEAGGLAAFTGWPGAILALSRPRGDGPPDDLQPAGWRARGRPVVLREQGDELTIRSPLDGSTHHLTSSGLARAALDVGATPVTEVLHGGSLAWWDAREDDLPAADMVVSAVPAAAARAGYYSAAGGWAEIAAELDSAAVGPLAAGCQCHTCEIASIGYMSHLWRQREITAAHLLGWHNLHQARLLVEGLPQQAQTST